MVMTEGQCVITIYNDVTKKIILQLMLLYIVTILKLILLFIVTSLIFYCVDLRMYQHK